MKFDTDLGYAFMHLYLTLQPKKSPAYDPTEEGYISDEEESRIHHFAEFIRYSGQVTYGWDQLRQSGQSKEAVEATISRASEEGWQDFMNHFTESVNGEIEFDEKELPGTFEKFAKDVHRLCSRPTTQIEIELAKSLNNL